MIPKNKDPFTGSFSKNYPFFGSNNFQFHYCFSLCYLFTLLLGKIVTSTSTVASIKLLNLMSPDTVMEASRIRNVFSEVLHILSNIFPIMGSIKRQGP